MGLLPNEEESHAADATIVLPFLSCFDLYLITKVADGTRSRRPSTAQQPCKGQDACLNVSILTDI